MITHPSLNLGIIYRRSNKFWNIDYLINSLKNYKNLNLKLVDVSNNNTIIPSDLDSLVLLPSECDILSDLLKSNQYNIKWVHSMFAGVDKLLKIKEISDNDSIILTNSRGAFADSLAEHAIFSMLYFYYNTPTYLNHFKLRKWTQPLNKMIKHKTLAIIGYGQNGAALAKKAKLGFNMNIIAVKKNINQLEGKEYVDEIFHIENINEVISKSDFIVNFLPHTPETINFYDHSKFSLMNSDCVFINLGRGSSVVEEDLIECLKNRRIKGASLDVTQEEPLDSTSPLFDLENLFLSFHSADNTEDYFRQAVDVLKMNLDAYLEDERLITIVDKKKGY